MFVLYTCNKAGIKM